MGQGVEMEKESGRIFLSKIKVVLELKILFFQFKWLKLVFLDLCEYDL